MAALRQCGECTLCCKLVPVAGLNKPGGVKCKHQRFRTGCVIYRKEGFPLECSLWACRWLVTDVDLPRPDHGHYCVDIVPDYVTVRSPGHEDVPLGVIQIWIDPHYPDAHRDPKLRKWLEAMSREGWVALVRYSPYEAMTLIPPILSDTGDWEEIENGEMSEETHNGEQIAAKLNQAGILP